MQNPPLKGQKCRKYFWFDAKKDVIESISVDTIHLELDLFQRIIGKSSKTYF